MYIYFGLDAVGVLAAEHSLVVLQDAVCLQRAQHVEVGLAQSRAAADRRTALSAHMTQLPMKNIIKSTATS